MSARRPRDPEIRAIEAIVTALDSLDNDDTRARVLRYLNRRYDELPSVPQPTLPPEQTREDTP